MIISKNNNRIDRLQTDVAISKFISESMTNFPITACATPLDISGYKNTAGTFVIPKLYPLELLPKNLTAFDDSSMADGFRKASPRVGSIKISEEWLPISIVVSEQFQNQSKMSFAILATRLLARYKAELLELKLCERLASDGEGRNGSSIADMASDLSEIITILRERQGAEVFQESLATTQINTSGVTKAFACIGSPRASRKIAEAYKKLNDGGFISNWQYAGATNISNYSLGVYAPDNLQVSWCSNPSYRDEIVYIFGGDSFMIANPSISNDGIFITDPLTNSPIASHYHISSRNVINIGVQRREHIFTYRLPTA